METQSIQGKPSRKAVAAAINTHLKVLRGEALKPALSNSLGNGRNLGGQERRFAAFASRELSRHMRLLDWVARGLGHPPSSFSLKEDQAIVRYVLWRRVVTGEQWPRIEVEVGLPGPIRPRSVRDGLLETLATAPLPAQTFASEMERLATLHSFPAWLAECVARVVPAAELEPLMAALNREQPLILRARPPGQAAGRQSELLQQGISPEPLPYAPDALAISDGGRSVFDSELMRRGALQVMDLGSQLIVQLCRPPMGFSGAAVADVCAGAGGKTLYLADLVGEQGTVWAADVSSKRLDEARRRVRQLRINNVRFVPSAPLERVSTVLVDAPCSGTGTIAREPDQKWRLSAREIGEYCAKQRALLDEVAPRLRPGAVLVYATCSLLVEENEQLVDDFLSRHPDFTKDAASSFLPNEVCQDGYLRLLPHRSPGSGFFAARLVKRSS